MIRIGNLQSAIWKKPNFQSMLTSAITLQMCVYVLSPIFFLLELWRRAILKIKYLVILKIKYLIDMCLHSLCQGYSVIKKSEANIRENLKLEHQDSDIFFSHHLEHYK